MSDGDAGLAGDGSRAAGAPDFLASPGLRLLLSALPCARVVGGAVRDWLAGRPIADIDLATPAPPETVQQRLEAAGVRTIPTGLSHGTVTALIDGIGYEITTLRRDVATDGRHAETVWTDDWREDAARRDFTINAMSLRADGGLFDPFGGAADLAAGRVRFVGDPARRIEEDYLRILRFFRFHARYGRGEPDAAAMAAIIAGRGGIARLSAERVWSELALILIASAPGRGGSPETVMLMAETGVLAAVLPGEAVDWAGAAHRLAIAMAAGIPADPLLRLAVLARGWSPVALAARLRLSGADHARLAAWQAAPLLAADVGDDALRRARADHSQDALAGRLWIEAAASPALLARLASMPGPVFPLEGRDVVAFGVVPGPAVGAALRRARAWWLRGGCVADAAACRGWLADDLARGEGETER